jgi:hypothetical protein
MKERMIIYVKAARDKEFEDSYWSFDIREELGEVFGEFEKQFEIRFKLAKIEKWNSVGSPNLRSFPRNVLEKLPKGIFGGGIMDYVLKEISENMKIPLTLSYERIKQLKADLEKDKSKNYQMHFLIFYIANKKICIIFPPTLYYTLNCGLGNISLILYWHRGFSCGY